MFECIKNRVQTLAVLAAPFLAALPLSFVVSTDVLAQGCRYRAKTDPLVTKDGYVEFIIASKMAPYFARLPQLENANLNTIMRASDTMWYDDESMTFLYQDSEETVVGGRANCVGRDVGERNRNSPV